MDKTFSQLIVETLIFVSMHQILTFPDIRLIQKLDTGYPVRPDKG
jgi:hypothetical protein